MTNRLIMAHLCHVSYFKTRSGDFDLSRINSYLYGITPSLKVIRTYNEEGTQALFLESERYNIVVFRGSEENIDWQNNFNFSMDRKEKIHTGFLRATRKVSDDIIWFVRNLKVIKPLYITGHSLGGACATVLAHFFNQKGIRYHSVYTFGQPRVFGVNSARRFDKLSKNKFYRYQNNNDAVTLAPPAFLGFKHVGQLQYITTDKKIVNGIPLFDRLKGLFLGLGEKGIDFSEDHSIKKYIDAM